MHDLMHDLAEQVSARECYMIEGSHSNTAPPGIRHLSITGDGNDESANFPTEKYEVILQKIRPLQKLRSLMYFGSSSVHLLKSIQTVLKEAKCLRLLRVYVSNADISATHTFLNPYHLRYLEFICVSDTKDMVLYGDYRDIAFPRALTSFYHLQVLNVGFSGNLAVPAAMNNLVNLRHLIANPKVHFSIGGVGNMISLQELKFKVQNDSSFGIRQLQYMNKLVTLGIFRLENVKTKEEANGARLIDKEYLEWLSLTWSGGIMSLEQSEIAKDVLEGLQPHHNLKTLRITGYNGPTSPTWLSCNLSVTSLRTIRLQNCSEWRILRFLEMLPMLRKLVLAKMWNLVELSIPSLEKLVLIDMPKLEKCIGTYGIELTSHLRVLKIQNCPQLNNFTPFQSFSPSATEHRSWFLFLSILTIEHCPHISKWEILSLREMQALKQLELIHLHSVKELLVPPLQKLVLIQMASLEYCSGLTSPLQISTSLGDRKESLDLTVHDCPRLVISHPLPFSALMHRFSIRGIPTLPTMEGTCEFIIKSDELIMLDDKILAFHNFGRTRSFRIKDCPNLVSVSTEGLNQCTLLEELHLTNCPKLIFPSRLVLPSLRLLSIQACGDILGYRLTQMLSHVRSMDSLELNDIPRIRCLSLYQPAKKEGSNNDLEAMPSSGDEQLLEIPSNILPSLKRIDISDCPELKLVGLGQEGALLRYTSLERLRIQRCPKLMPLLVSGEVGVGLLPPSLVNLEIDMSPELSAAWDLKLQEHAQIQAPHPSLEELDISSLGNHDQSRLLQHCFPSITALYIWRSPELTFLQLGHLTALCELEIVDCVSLASIEGVDSLTSLRSLGVSGSPGVPRCLELLSQQQQGASEVVLSGLETLQIGDGAVLTVSLCRRLTSLRRLSFWSWGSKRDNGESETMVGLTDEQERALQLLAAGLRRLDFWRLPNLRRLPANLPRLTSLEWLDIDDCPGVAGLPEMGLPPSLTRRSSEELRAQCVMAATEEKIDVQIDDVSVN
uniref:R13L1/DRL21-like LRR repeat region domain-containing protein n=1 Tax=Oryza brachyantha TaxID=4533 RepID=J3N8G5_ORYBR